MADSPYKLRSFVKKHSQIVVYLGTTIVFLTFVIKEGLAESWSKAAETLDTAQYMYAIAVFDSVADTKLTRILDQLESVKTVREARNPYVPSTFFLPREMQLRGMAEIARLDGLIASTLILVERLPELKSMEAECERLRNALSDGKSEIEFLSSRDEGEILAEIKSGDHKTWDYKPKHQRSYYKLPISPANRRPIDVLIIEDDNNVEMLTRDIADFNKGVLDEAKVVRERDERKSRFAWWIAAGLFTLGWILGLFGKIYGVPLETGEGR